MKGTGLEEQNTGPGRSQIDDDSILLPLQTGSCEIIIWLTKDIQHEFICVALSQTYNIMTMFAWK